MIGTMAHHGKITLPPSVRNFGCDFASTHTTAPLAFGGDYRDIVVLVFLRVHDFCAVFLSSMTNISSSLEVYLSVNGFMMLAIGSPVGAVFAMLVARDVDFVTAMIASFQAVQNNFFNLMIWAMIIAGFTFLSMLPWVLGLFVTLPLFGHAAWHLYELAT